MARKLAVRLYWRWRNGWDYSQLVEFGSHAGTLGTGHGVKQNFMVEVLIEEMFGSD